MSPVGSVYTLDTAAAEAALDRLAQADADLRGALTTTAQAGSAGLLAAAQAATAYSDRMAAATAEVRTAQAATRDAAAEVQRLVQANRDLAAAQSNASSSAEYDRLAKLIAQNTAKIREAKQAILDNKQATDQERAAVQAVSEARRQETNQTKLVTAAAKDAAAAAKEEAAAQKEVGAATGETGAAGGLLSGVLGKVGGAFAAFFAFNKLKQVAKDIIDTTSEFQRMEAVLTTINGGDSGKGKLEFANLRAFTLRNPFEVAQVTEAYIQLRNRGINPTIGQLQSLADLAAASGKSFEQVTEGLLGATTGQFRRLKEFGVTAKQEGDNVALTFRGVTTTVQKSQGAIAAYVLSLGQLNGVAGATERIMNTTGGRITNLKDSFTELFATIGEGNSGPLNGFIKKLTQIVTAIKEANSTVEQKALNKLAATGALESYGKIADQIFAQASANAKKAGTDVSAAITAAADQQNQLLTKQLAKAQAAVKQIPADYSEEYYKQYGATLDNKEGSARAEKDRVEAQRRVALIQGEIGALKERATVALKGHTDEATQLGLIAALRAKIAEEEKTREETTDPKKIHTLNLQIIADNKELDALLEKQDKSRKKQAGSFETQLRALLAERETLTSLAAKAAVKSADDAAEQAKSVFEEALRQVDVVKAKLEQRELDLAKQARKVGGAGAVRKLGTKADGQVDGVQAEQLTTIRLAALDKYYQDLYQITQAREQRLFDLRALTDEKEVEEVDRKYDKLIKTTTDNIERQLIEEARVREQLRLQFDQQARRDDEASSTAAAAANRVGATYGTGTGISLIEAKRAEKQALLEIEKKHAEDVINNSLLLNNKEGEAIRAGAEVQLQAIRRSIQEVEAEKAQHRPEDFLYKLVLGENDLPERRLQLEQTTQQVLGSVNQILSAQLAAAQQKIQAHDQNISSLQSQLGAEIQLNKTGAASNIKGILDQIAAEKAARREAVAEQKKIAAEQRLIQDLTAISSISLAVANIIAGWSTVPLVGSILGIVAATAMVGSFIATKATATSAAKANGAGFFQGGYTGGDDVHEERGVVHGREFVHTAATTAQYRGPLFEALHAGRPQDIDWNAPAMRALLPDLSLPATLRAERTEAGRQEVAHTFAPMRAEFGQLHDRLVAIEASNQQMASARQIAPMEDGYLETDPLTGNTKRVKFI